jgi:hypothetical protein
MESHRRGIAWSEVSKYFRDAIAITRKLGIRYLWIDSLCIIQDDREDQELEAIKMGSVYGNAYLVLAATAAADGDVGCIFPRPISQEVRAAGHIILARMCPWKEVIRSSSIHTKVHDHLCSTEHEHTRNGFLLLESYISATRR